MLFRWGIFLLACGFLYDQLIDIKGTQAMDGLRALWHHGQGLPLLVLMLIGMVLNWTVESVKWRVLMRPVERIDAWRAFLGTIAGTSLALVTPNRTGEFIGRVLFLRPEARVAGAFATALGSMSQFAVTLIMGSAGLLFLLFAEVHLPWTTSPWITGVLSSLTLLVVVGTLVVYFHPQLVGQLLLMVPLLRSLHRPAQVLSQVPTAALRWVLTLSALRYLVFAGQFVGMLWWLEVQVPLPVMVAAVTVIYLVSTLIPTMLLTELGVRGSVAVGILAPLGGDAALVLLATFSVWAINLVLPALAGSVILLFSPIRVPKETP
jgi:hypothetical protein